jgi:hypothetical protein
MIARSSPPKTALDIGTDVTQRVHASALALGRSVAMATGLTPWTILSRVDKLWARATVGGAVTVEKLGPKEARIEVIGFPVSHIPYNRVATRGIVRGFLLLLGSSVWAHEVPALCTSTTLGYRLQWT